MDNYGQKLDQIRDEIHEVEENLRVATDTKVRIELRDHIAALKARLKRVKAAMYDTDNEEV